MKSNNELFFEAGSFALIGKTSRRNFPLLSYRKLKKRGKQVYAVDDLLDEIDGSAVYRSLSAIDQKIERIMIELPKENSLQSVQEANELGIKDIWIHMRCETPEVLRYCDDNGINVRYGTCAVMYLMDQISYHSIHKWIMKVLRKF